VLHPHLEELGFITFVQDAPSGHLFLTPSPNGDVLGPLQGIKNRLAEFGRTVVSDKNGAPNHGCIASSQSALRLASSIAFWMLFRVSAHAMSRSNTAR
jgi:hypothetical protein